MHTQSSSEERKKEFHICQIEIISLLYDETLVALNASYRHVISRRRRQCRRSRSFVVFLVGCHVRIVRLRLTLLAVTNEQIQRTQRLLPGVPAARDIAIVQVTNADFLVYLYVLLRT